jgi:hypothetical protein
MVKASQWCDTSWTVYVRMIRSLERTFVRICVLAGKTAPLKQHHIAHIAGAVSNRG